MKNTKTFLLSLVQLLLNTVVKNVRVYVKIKYQLKYMQTIVVLGINKLNHINY
jgi:hypothetical protein